MKNTLLISSSVAVLFTVAAAAQGAVPKPTDLYGFGVYAVVVAVAVFGGSLTWAKAYVNNDQLPHKFLRWFIEVGTACMMGLMTFWLCQSRDMDLILTNLAVAASAMGGTGVLEMIRGITNKAGR